MRKTEIEQIFPAELDELEGLMLLSLKNCHDAYQRLGPEGNTVKMEKPDGSFALFMDYQAEKEVIAVFQDRQPLFVTEEHGIFTRVENPRLVVVVDGVDGTDDHKLGNPSVTMVGVMSRDNPVYGNTFVAGMVEYPSGIIYSAVIGRGAQLITPDRKIQRLPTSSDQVFDPLAPMYIDVAFDEAVGHPVVENAFKRLLSGNPNLLHSSSTGIHIADVVTGKAILAGEATRGTLKMNVELPTCYRFTVEAGGAAKTLNGEDIGDKHFFNWGHDAYTPIIFGATERIVNETIEFLKQER